MVLQNRLVFSSIQNFETTSFFIFPYMSVQIRTVPYSHSTLAVLCPYMLTWQYRTGRRGSRTSRRGCQLSISGSLWRCVSIAGGLDGIQRQNLFGVISWRGNIPADDPDAIG